MDTRIYIMTHKKFDAPQAKGYYPLQVGRAGKEDLGYLGDDTGENISEKNGAFCELTGLYWIWKNVRCDIAGLCHYRRYLAKRETGQEEVSPEQKLLDISYIEQTLKTYDVIVPDDVPMKDGSMWNHYVLHHSIADWVECGRIILEKYPAYYTAFAWCQNSYFVSPCNMVITRKEILDEYCAWLFDILFEAERRIDTSSYNDYQKRIFGFLSERLFRVWLINHPLKIKEEKLYQVE